MEHLVAIAHEDAPAPPAGVVVLRFAGTPSDGEVAPDDLADLRDSVAALMKERFAPWLFTWARTSGALDIAHWEGGTSWWWFTPLSERSPQRSDLIHHLFQLLLLREVLRRDRPRRLTWYDSSPTIMAAAVAALAAEHGGAATVIRCGKPRPRRRLLSAIALHARDFLAELGRAALLRRATPRVPQPLAPPPRILFLTRFPLLWEQDGARWREIMFGRLPACCENEGLAIAYAAVTTGSPLTWLRASRSLRGALDDHRIHPLLSHVALGEIVASHCMAGFWLGYMRWRFRRRGDRVAFDGIDVTRLLLREVDLNAIDPHLPSNRLIARAVARLLRAHPTVQCLIHPFEFQPLERAAAVGARMDRRVSVVGLQTGIFTSGQLGWLLDPDEVRAGAAPLPDLLFAYGTLPQERFARALGRDRALCVGALRYGALTDFLRHRPPVAAVRARLGLAPGLQPILVACPAMQEETWPMLRAALAVGKARPDVILLFKFHHHLRLDAEAAALAEEAIPGRWRIFDVALYDLVHAAAAVVTGASSVSYEALALGRPALVYLAPARWHCNMATETPDAFAFWHVEAELKGLVERALSGALMPQPALRDDALSRQLVLDPAAETALIAVLRERVLG